MRKFLIGSLLFLAACSSGIKVTAPVVTIQYPMQYLVQSRLPDGNVDTPLSSGDPLTYRRQDFGGYMFSESYIANGGAITSWNFNPFQGLDYTKGDGGEKYVIEGDTVRIVGTRDGGTPHDQYFVGKNCGGTGWVLFRTDATSEWKTLVASLFGSADPNFCSRGSRSFTRYSMQTVTFPGIGPVETIISEHYDNETIESSVAMERFYFAKGWGRLAWKSFTKGFPVVDPSRCPEFDFHNALDGWNLSDCRIVTTIVPADGSLKGDDFWRM